MRIGHGYDVHRFAKGRKLMLCGVEVDYELGLLGHSDADAALHALADSILGALALGDIGKLFPDSDPRYKDADSALLLAEVMRLAGEKGYELGNCDITIVAQEPKLAPYIESAGSRRFADAILTMSASRPPPRKGSASPGPWRELRPMRSACSKNGKFLRQNCNA